MSKLLDELGEKEFKIENLPKKKESTYPFKKTKEFWIYTTLSIFGIVALVLWQYGFSTVISITKTTLFYGVILSIAVIAYTILIYFCVQLMDLQEDEGMAEEEGEEEEFVNNTIGKAILTSIFLGCVSLLYASIVTLAPESKIISQSVGILLYYVIFAMFYNLGFMKTAAISFATVLFRELVMFLVLGTELWLARIV